MTLPGLSTVALAMFAAETSRDSALDAYNQALLAVRNRRLAPLPAQAALDAAWAALGRADEVLRVARVAFAAAPKGPQPCLSK